MRFAVKLRMELAGDEERVPRQLDDFYQLTIRSEAAKHVIGFLKPFPVSIIKFVPMAMTFADDKGSIKSRRFRADYQLARLRSQAHRASLFRDASLSIEHRDDRVRCPGIELRGVRLGQL